MGKIKELYLEALRNVPILRYSWVLIATISILAFTAYFKLQNSDVFFYAFAVLAVSLFGFVLSFFTNTKDKIVKFAIYILLFSIVFTAGIAVLGFGTFIIVGKPDFYRQWFPEKINSIGKRSEDTIKSTQLNRNPDSRMEEPKKFNKHSQKDKSNSMDYDSVKISNDLEVGIANDDQIDSFGKKLRPNQFFIYVKRDVEILSPKDYELFLIQRVNYNKDFMFCFNTNIKEDRPGIWTNMSGIATRPEYYIRIVSQAWVEKNIPEKLEILRKKALDGDI